MKNQNIIAVLNLIRCLSLKSLKNAEVIANLIRAFGLANWIIDGVFGEDEKYKNVSTDMAGIYQTPDQLGKALVYLSDFHINSYCEIGTFQGGSFVFMSEYLKRFNANINCLAIDPTQYLNPEINNVIEAESYLSFMPITSDQISGNVFDLCFIDGDHSTEWLTRDWNNIGQYAKICMLHDINEQTCPDVIAFWQTIKGENSIEFIDHTCPYPAQGIGIIHK